MSNLILITVATNSRFRRLEDLPDVSVLTHNLLHTVSFATVPAVSQQADLFTFLSSLFFFNLGITCPRAGRIVTSQGVIATEGDPHGDEALNFTKDLCLQREVNPKEIM